MGNNDFWFLVFCHQNFWMISSQLSYFHADISLIFLLPRLNAKISSLIKAHVSIKREMPITKAQLRFKRHPSVHELFLNMWGELNHFRI